MQAEMASATSSIHRKGASFILFSVGPTSVRTAGTLIPDEALRVQSDHAGIRYSVEMSEKKRCWWANQADPDYVRYHDEEWGQPAHDDRHLFEMLVLEGAQAGLSWSTILHKRANYRRAFAGFDPKKVACFDAPRVEALVLDAGIVRNRLKIESAITNARAFLEVQREFGSFDRYLWSFVDGRPIVNRPRTRRGVPAHTPLSDRISKDLKKRGFRFVGTTIVYAYLQAVGVVNDHTRDCYLSPVTSSG
jgi:DNA-3-methyladenine glycosylase I